METIKQFFNLELPRLKGFLVCTLSAVVIGAEVGSTRRRPPRGPTMMILGFVILTLVSSSGRAAAVNDAQEHDSNINEAAVIDNISVENETSILPEMAPIEGTTRGSREEKAEEEEEFVEEWAAPSMSPSTEDESIASSGAASVFEGDVGVSVGVSASGIELDHTQEDGGTEMGDADGPSIDATPPDTAEGSLTDADYISSILPDSHDEFDANDGFVAEEDNGGSSLDNTEVPSSARGGDDVGDVNAEAAHEIAATGGEEKEKEKDKQEDENGSHQQERKQELEAEEVTLARGMENEESVRGVIAALASSDGVGEQAVAGGGDGEGEGGIQAGKDADSDSDSGSGSGSGDDQALCPGKGWGTVVVDSEQKLQTVVGFGGAFTDASTINFYKLPAHVQEKVRGLYYC